MDLDTYKQSNRQKEPATVQKHIKERNKCVIRNETVKKSHIPDLVLRLEESTRKNRSIHSSLVRQLDSGAFPHEPGGLVTCHLSRPRPTRIHSFILKVCAPLTFPGVHCLRQVRQHAQHNQEQRVHGRVPPVHSSSSAGALFSSLVLNPPWPSRQGEPPGRCCARSSRPALHVPSAAPSPRATCIMRKRRVSGWVRGWVIGVVGVGSGGVVVGFSARWAPGARFNSGPRRKCKRAWLAEARAGRTRPRSPKPRPTTGAQQTGEI